MRSLYFFLFGKTTTPTTEAEDKQCCMRLQIFFYFISVPFLPPDNFAVTAVSSTSITAIWQLPPADTNNGIIKGFKLFYKKKGYAGLENSEFINGTTFTRTVTGLLKYTEYEFQVLAFTSGGDGPRSSILTERTNEDCKLNANNIPLSRFVKVQWFPRDSLLS